MSELNASTTVAIDHEADILAARKAGREVAQKLGFGGTDLVLIATAISEIARNIILYGKRGQMVFDVVAKAQLRGLTVTARDEGPGIADIPKAMQDGYSTGKGLGLGLPGARRLMDEFEIASRPGEGTTVVMTKWTR